MRVGIIVDGQAEQAALTELVRRVRIRTRWQVLNPLYADVQPLASPRQIARAALGRVRIWRTRDVDKVVLAIDRESNGQCPSVFAGELSQAFADLGEAVCVVVKDRSFENWLIGDPASLRSSMPKRFDVTPAFERVVVPNRADQVVNAAALLRRVSIGREYHKRRDACAIARVIDPTVMARNSRSFRRFLREIGSPTYQAQSRDAV